MLFYNINNPAQVSNLKDAVFSAIGVGEGLYMPASIPRLNEDFFSHLQGMNLREIAFRVSSAMLSDDLPLQAIERICEKAFTFDIPLKQLDESIYVLELFHGPTLAFKDAGARYMAALFEYLLEQEERQVTVLVATSGDTGSAVASAFYGCKGVNVIILFPSGRVSHIQEKMLTTMGGNITAVEINGDFDDCQSLVKQAFSDPLLKNAIKLTSANSINFARLFPQSFYYFYALAQLRVNNKHVTISVPSGNFGNLTAGLMAYRMGLNVEKFIASTNRNHAVVDYLESGEYMPGKSIPTITNAMDVGSPNNFPRLKRIFNDDHEAVSSMIRGYWFNDDETMDGIRELYNRYSYISDPHGAVAWLGLKKYSPPAKNPGIFLETAHPVKFMPVVSNALDIDPDLPEKIRYYLESEGNAVRMEASYSRFRDFLLSTAG